LKRLSGPVSGGPIRKVPPNGLSWMARGQDAVPRERLISAAAAPKDFRK